MTEVLDQIAPATETKMPPPRPPKTKIVASPAPWRPMGERPEPGLTRQAAPYDGTFVYLLGDPKHGEWYWYQTRQFRKGSWQPIAWWRMRFGENSPPKFTPSGWRPVSEGLLA